MGAFRRILVLSGVIFTGSIAACGISGSSDVGFGEGSGGGADWGYGGDYSGYGGYGYGSTNTTTTGTGEPPPPPPVLDPNAGDAGPDAAQPTGCDGLDQSKPLVLYLSADDSNSMASPAHARESLRLGSAPHAIRTYEFLNYYKIDYPAPPVGQLSLVAQGEAGAEPGAIDVQIGVRSFDPLPRRPMTITFVLDTSGSMAGESMEREKAVVRALAASMKAGDIASIVTWNHLQSVVLQGHQVSGPNDPALLAAADSLSADGSTDLSAGLQKGYELAKQYYGSSRMNRVILVSDGGANTGVTDEQIIALNSEDADKEGIYLVGVGTGPADGYNDLLMDIVTDKGRGAYVYVDSKAEATQMFTHRFDEVMEVAARAVQVQLTLPWYFRMAKFYGEEYSTDPKQIEPQHLAPGDAMIFNQVLKACDPALVNGQDTITVRANWQVPLSYTAASTELTLTVDALLASSKVELHKGKAIVAYAEALKTGSPTDLAAAHDAVVAANPGATDPELNEIASLIVLHSAYPK